MSLIVVPCAILRIRAIKVELVNAIVTPGMTGSGMLPIVATDGGGLWSLTFGDVLITSPTKVRAWRAITGLCGGGVNKLIVPLCDTAHNPWPIVDGEPLTGYGPITHDDGTLFNDGTGYDQNVIDIEAAAAELGDTTLTITVNYGSELLGGEHFSIDHATARHRLYRVLTVSGTASPYTITIAPPLREDIGADTFCEFDEPKVIMQPATPNALDLQLDIINIGRPSPELIEAAVA